MSLFANHFEVFDLPISFDIDTDALAQRYRELQRTVHPDKYAQAPDRERRLAMQKATQINEAFQTLKTPLNRGLYLLQLHGMDTHDNQVAMDGEFLMSQMTLREELGEIKQQKYPLEALNQFLSRVEQAHKELIETLSRHFAHADYQAAFDSVRQLQFFTRLYEEALRLEEDIL
jgi:molecular chaperone HscB